MRRSLGIVALCAISFAAGAVAQRLYDRRALVPDAGSAGAAATTEPVEGSRTAVDFSRQPLWAYGFLEPPKPGDKATPQAPPTRDLRPNEDATEQTRPRQAPGSSAPFSLVDIRDGGNVIDWFPQDHPSMPDIIRLGPSKMTTGRRGCGFCHLPNGLGRPENAPTSGLSPAYFVQQLREIGRAHV